MPQKTTRRPGPRTSGTADSGGFGLGERLGVTRVEELLESRAERFAVVRELRARPPFEPDHADGLFPASIQPDVTLGLAESAETSHEQTVRRGPDGSSARRAG